MKNVKKIMALMLAMVMVLSMAIPAIADTTGSTVTGKKFTYEDTDKTDDGVITLKNSTKDTTYMLYKIFDANFDGDKVAYTTTNKNLALDADYFTISQQADSLGRYAVTRTMGDDGKTPKKSDTELISYLKDLDVSLFTKIGGIKSSENGPIKWDKVPYGYFVIVPDKPEEPKAAVTIDSNVPTVEVIDKNSIPSWDNGDNKPGKVIIEQDEDGIEVKTSTNEAKLNEDVTFDIGVDATNYAGDKQVLEYVIYDDIDLGMTYKAGATNFKVTVVNNNGTEPAITTINAYDADTNPTGYTLTYYDKDKNVTTTLADAQYFKVKIPWVTTTTVEGKEVHTSLYATPVEIHVRYVAFLDPAKKDEVNVGATPNNNKADFDWKDTGDDTEPDWDTPNHDVPEKDTKTYTTSVTIHKTDGSKELKGAEFQLVGQTTNVVMKYNEAFTEWVDGTSTGDKYWLLKNGTYTKDDPDTKKEGSEEYKYDRSLYDLDAGVFAKTSSITILGDPTSTTPVDIKAYVNDDGTLTFAGLADGTYTIKETVVPKGYNRAEDIQFTITHTKDEENKKVTFASNNPNVVLDATNNVFNVTIVNKQGAKLPSTGGIGTTMFYVVGSILVIGAAVLLISKRRMNAR